MLEKFREAKEMEIRVLRERGVPPPYAGSRPDFAAALRGPNIRVVAEYKRASPSRGAIREDVEVETACAQYAGAGAAALSILTETDWFRGDLSFVARAAAFGLPILRKDFILDPAQVEASAATPASAILLIVRLTPHVADLRALREKAESFGMQAVVEAFNGREVDIARQSGANIIQINARDLDKLRVDRAACLRLIGECQKLPGETWIAASGMETGQHLVEARKAGYDAALIGTALMKDGEPGRSLEKILADCRAASKG